MERGPRLIMMVNFELRLYICSVFVTKKNFQLNNERDTRKLLGVTESVNPCFKKIRSIGWPVVNEKKSKFKALSVI